MPIYEFVCEKCDNKEEKIVKFNTEIIECPICGSNMKKIMSSSNFHLKGHFWYKDGYGLHGNEKKG